VTIEGIAIGLLILAALYLALVVGLMITGRGALAREVATFLPNLVMLFRGLAADSRVPSGPRLRWRSALSGWHRPST
jgi:lipopolysaccharide export LptBFGC system permease protein LptF